MTCPHCALWELATGDLTCAWCGASFLHFTLHLDPQTLNPEDYPPPIQLHIHNKSPLAPITLDGIQPNQPWITLLPHHSLPQTIDPGANHTLLLDVDTFAPSITPEAQITVAIRYAPASQTAVLHLQTPAT